jgi:FdrA protein
MAIQFTIKANLYKDSVSLMRISQLAMAQSGAKRVTLLMGTGSNKDFLSQAALMDPALDPARPGDIMIVVEADSADQAEAALQKIQSLIAGDGSKEELASPSMDLAPRSIFRAASLADQADLALISVPGPYAAAEALKALRQGLNVMIFSDNVPVREEQFVKEVAARKGLLVMGPDCGTAIINGIPLGFANVVRRGVIGLVGASGTGLQQVMCRIDQLGQGISHAIGTGSHDVGSEVGGITTLQGLDLLAANTDTKVVVIVSKPPAPDVEKRVLDRAGKIGKPVVVCFLGGDHSFEAENVHHVSSLEEAARTAVSLAGGSPPAWNEAVEGLAAKICASLASGQRHLRGLYSGGTFCLEAQLIWRDAGIYARSNAPLASANRLVEGESGGHVALDLGSDEFTVGRPHPMIDYSVRLDRLRAEAEDPTAACVVLDVVLGYGSHPNPAGVLAPAIGEAKTRARANGRELSVVCFVCGTGQDPQSFDAQHAALAEAGAVIVESSTSAAYLAAAIANRMASQNGGARRRAG